MKNTTLKLIGGATLLLGLYGACFTPQQNEYLTVTQAVVNNHDTITNYLQCDTIPQHILKAIKSYDKVLKSYKDIRLDVLSKIPPNGAKLTINDPALKQSYKNICVYYRDQNNVFQETIEIISEQLIYTMTYDKDNKPYICEIKNKKTNITYTIYYSGSLIHKTFLL